jgi:hypothetical protein
MSIYRTLADERIPLSDRLFKLGINLTAGAKLTDVDVERTRKQAARNVLTDILDMQPGVKTYENITVPEDVLRAMPRDQQQMYLLYKILQGPGEAEAGDGPPADAGGGATGLSVSGGTSTSDFSWASRSRST